MSDKKKQNSEVFPPRGSFLNLPDDVLVGANEKSLDNILKDRNDNIGSDLYKESNKK